MTVYGFLLCLLSIADPFHTKLAYLSQQNIGPYPAMSNHFGHFCLDDTAVNRIIIKPNCEKRNMNKCLDVICVNVTETIQRETCEWREDCITTRKNQHEGNIKKQKQARKPIMISHAALVTRGIRFTKDKQIQFFCCREQMCTTCCKTKEVNEDLMFEAPRDSWVIVKLEANVKKNKKGLMRPDRLNQFMFCHIECIFPCNAKQAQEKIATELDGQNIQIYPATINRFGMICPKATAVNRIFIKNNCDDSNNNKCLDALCVNVTETRDRKQSCEWRNDCVTKNTDQYQTINGKKRNEERKPILINHASLVTRGIRMTDDKQIEFFCCKEFMCTECCRSKEVEENHLFQATSKRMVIVKLEANGEKKKTAMADPYKLNRFKFCHISCSTHCNAWLNEDVKPQRDGAPPSDGAPPGDGAVPVIIIALPETTTVENCKDKTYDILFIMDGSNSIKEENFVLQQNFVKQIIAQFTVGPDDTHVAYMQFSSDVTLHFNFDKYYQTAAINAAIDAVVQMKRYTYLGEALASANSNALTPAQGRRPGKEGLVFVVTDGESNDNPSLAAAEMKANGYEVWAIGVGPSVYVPQLSTVPTDPSKMLLVDSFVDLGDELLTKIEEGKCPSA